MLSYIVPIVMSCFVFSLIGCAGLAGDVAGQQVVIHLLARQIVPASKGVRITCDLQDISSDAGTPSISSPKPEIKIIIREMSDSRLNKQSVGEMFNWHRPENIKIVLGDEMEFKQILLSDIEKILQLSRFALEDSIMPNGPDVLLDLELIEAWVKSSPGGWTELKGTIQGLFIFKGVFTDTKTGNSLERVFTGEEVRKILYSSEKLHEDVLGKAYCNALNSFAEFIAFREPKATKVDAPIKILRLPKNSYPDDIAIGEGYLWVGIPGDFRKLPKTGHIMKIDPKKFQIVETISVGAWPKELVPAFGSLWFIHRLWDEGFLNWIVSRILTDGNKVIDLNLPVKHVTAQVAGGDYIWIVHLASELSFEKNLQLSKINSRNNQIIETKVYFNAGTDISDIAYGEGYIWALDGGLPGRKGTVYQIDPITDSIVAAIPVNEYGKSITVGAGAIWVVNAGGEGNEPGTVSRIDPKRSQVITTITVGNYPFDITVGGNAIWVGNLVDRTISRIDPATNQVTETINVGKAPRRLTFGEGALWFTSEDDNTVNRMEITQNY